MHAWMEVPGEMWGPSCSHRTKIWVPTGSLRLKWSSSTSHGPSSRPDSVFPQRHVCRTMRHWVPHPSWASCWAEKSGFPTSSPTLSWLNHTGCFPLLCLGPLGSSWLRHHWSLSRDTHPPAPEPSFVRHVAFLGMLSHLRALAPHPRAGGFA